MTARLFDMAVMKAGRHQDAAANPRQRGARKTARPSGRGWPGEEGSSSSPVCATLRPGRSATLNPRPARLRKKKTSRTARL